MWKPNHTITHHVALQQACIYPVYSFQITFTWGKKTLTQNDGSHCPTFTSQRSPDKLNLSHLRWFDLIEKC